MSAILRKYARESGIEIYGLGTDRAKWETALQRYTVHVVRGCIWAFGETRTEPSLEKYVFDWMGISNNSELAIGDRIKVVAGFNIGAKGVIQYIEPSGKLWVRRDGASSDVFYMRDEVVRE